MKKIYLLLAMLTSGAMLTHAGQTATLLPVQAAPSMRVSAAVEAQMKQSGEAAQRANKAPEREAVVDGYGFIIQAEGQRYDYMLSEYEATSWGSSSYAGIGTEVYFNDADSAVYIKNLLRMAVNGAYIKGVLTSGDRHNGVITIANNQLCGKWIGRYIYATIMAENESGTLDADPYAESFELTIANDTIHGEGVYIAGTDQDYNVMFMQGNNLLEPIDLESMQPLTIPEGANSQYYTLSDCDDGTTTRSDLRVVTISRLGNDFYFNDVFSAGDGPTFKGTLNGSKIEVAMPQFALATSYLGNYMVYKYVNTCWMTANEDGTYNYGIDAPGTLYLDYDEATGTITASDTTVLALLSGSRIMDSHLYAPRFVKYDLQTAVVPEDATINTYWLNSEYDDQGNHQGAIVKIARSGEDFYFMRADGVSDEILFKGYLDSETNEIIAESKQFVGIINGAARYFGPAKSEIVTKYDDWEETDITYIDYTFDEEAFDASFTYDPATGNIKCNDVIAITDEAHSWLYNYYIRPNYILISDPVNTIPEGAETSQYVLTAKEQGNGTAQVIDVARQGDDLYFTIPTGYNLDDMTIIKGTIKGDKVNFAIPQFISEDGMFLRIGDEVEKETQSDELDAYHWTEWIDDNTVTSIDMNYDSETGVISYDDDLWIIDVKGKSVETKCSDRIMSDWKTMYLTLPLPIFKPYAPKATTPADPYNLLFKDKSEDYAGRYRFDFYVAFEDVDGNYINSDSISWRLYMDSEDSVFVFRPQEYPEDFTENTTDVWFTHPRSSSLPHPYNAVNMRSVYMQHSPDKKIGVRTSFHYDGEVHHSNIVWYVINSDGIAEVLGDGTATVVGYYDLQGRQLTAPATDGITIVKMSDGTAHKIVVK